MRTLGLLALLLGLPGAAPAAQPATPDLKIQFLDVGQGDAILVTVGPKAVLIDASRGRDIILVLRDAGIDSLTAAIASHNHDDHVGGMPAVLSDLPVGRYYSNGRAPENANTAEVLGLLAERRIPHAAGPWPPIQLGDVHISVLPPPVPGTSENNASLGVLIERGRFKALLTGDSEEDELKGWLATGAIPDVDVLKAAHHGARNGVSPGWIDRTKPEVVVISVGAGNGYGHPDPAALRYYSLHGRPVYRTDRHGTVTVTVDAAGGYRVETSGPRAR